MKIGANQCKNTNFFGKVIEIPHFLSHLWRKKSSLKILSLITNGTNYSKEENIANILVDWPLYFFSTAMTPILSF